MKLAMILAMANNGVIGDKGKLPWHFPEDLRYFKSKTFGKSIIMGRKTYEGLGKALPGRENYVLTTNPYFHATDVKVRDSIDQVLSELSKKDLVYVIGGKELYLQFLSLTDIIFLTHVHVYADGDTSMPDSFLETLSKDFIEINRVPNEGREYLFDFVTYLRK